MAHQDVKSRRRYWFIVGRGMLRFVAILVAMFCLAGRINYWQAWGYGVSGLAAGVVHRFAEGRVHSRQPSQLGRLIRALRAASRVIDLLECHHVRLHPLNHSHNPWQVEFAVRPFAVVDVVAEHADGRRLDRFSQTGGQCP
jgi:hypothetical protein